MLTLVPRPVGDDKEPVPDSDVSAWEFVKAHRSGFLARGGVVPLPVPPVHDPNEPGALEQALRDLWGKGDLLILEKVPEGAAWPFIDYLTNCDRKLCQVDLGGQFGALRIRASAQVVAPGWEPGPPTGVAFRLQEWLLVRLKVPVHAHNVDGRGA